MGLHPSSWSYRLYRVRFGTAFALSLPFLLASGWYAWSAFARFDRYRRAEDASARLTAELFHLNLYDELSTDVRRFRLEARPLRSALPTFSVSLARKHLDTMNEGAKEGTEVPYAKSHLEKDGVLHEADVRQRGSQHWHRLGQQKSLKFKVDKGDLVDGVRFFNLVNDVTPLGLEEQVILDLAREHGLLTPEYYPAWLRLNNSDMGVYRYVAQPAEGLIRRARRMPGSLYSGDTNNIDDAKGLTSLFSSQQGWKKIAWRTDEERENLTELDWFLNSVNGASHADFVKFAREALDLPRFALFDAFDVVFGGSQHDNLSNQKLYFDAYRGRFEPIAWSYRAFAHEPLFHLVEHPLLLRLESVPDYAVLRNRLVYELLMGDASVPAIRARINRLFESVKPDLEADPYWDAYKLTPRVSRFVRFMVRPMTASRWLLSAQAELHDYSRRTRFLLDALEEPGLEAHAQGSGDTVRVELAVGGHAAYTLHELVLEGDCQGPLEVYADRDQNGALTPADGAALGAAPVGERLRLSTFNRLTARLGWAGHEKPTAKTGKVRSVRSPEVYRYLVHAPACRIERAVLSLENLITGASLKRRLDVEPQGSVGKTPVQNVARASAVPAFAPGEVVPHPWTLPQTPVPATVHLGPGVVEFRESRAFEAYEPVVIAPGTRLLLAKGVSLYFRGRLTALGTPVAPIEVSSPPGEHFGGLVLHGPETAGSELRHLRVQGGSRPAPGFVDYSGTLNIYDTTNVLIADSTFSDVVDADDVIHATYVKDIKLNEVRVLRAPTDAIDLEFTTGEVRGAFLSDPGDECLDLMGVDLRVLDSVLVGCTNSGISAGEESKVRAHGVLIAHSKTGVLSKNTSEVHVSRSLIYHAESGLRTNKQENHYNAPSHIEASELVAAECEKVTREAGNSTIKTAEVQRTLGGQSALAYLRTHVLHLDTWDHLDTFLRDFREGKAP